MTQPLRPHPRSCPRIVLRSQPSWQPQATASASALVLMQATRLVPSTAPMRHVKFKVLEGGVPQQAYHYQTPKHATAMSTTEQRPPGKLLIQMSGAPGSGKSTVARLLRPRINSIIIDHDILRSALLEAAIIPFDDAAKQAYLLQWKLAEDFINQGVSVIVDSTCNYPEVLERGIALAARHGYTYWYVECQVGDIDLLDERLRNRPAMASQRSAINCPPVAAQDTEARVDEDARALFEKWMKSPCRPDEGDCIITLDSTRSPEMLCEQILERVAI